jgi:NAD(P)H dehydrogenase (quinone)
MILVTGATGKTGLAIIDNLLKEGKTVRGFARSSKNIEKYLSNPNFSFVSGSFANQSDVDHTMDGVKAVYHICPNVNPNEVEFGKRVIDSAINHNVKHFVYHSVIYPQIESMPHHWNKLRVEEYLIRSSLPFTILQPTAYMENVLGQEKNILDNNIYVTPYCEFKKISLISLSDVAEVANIILNNPKYFYGTFPLASEQSLSGIEIAEKLSKKINLVISAKSISISQWKENTINSGLSEFAINTLSKMFAYYDEFPLISNHLPLQNILGRKSTNFEQFLKSAFN